jgi:hypothetical protein
MLGCESTLTLPGDAVPAHIDIVTGDDQAGVVGSALPLPLVVLVTDSLDRAVVDQTVEFSVQTGGGQITPASVTTGSDGRASATWTLGPGAGLQQVRAQAVGGGAPATLLVAFSATAISGSGSLIAAVSGNDQTAPVNSALADSLIVKVSDGNGNPVSGVTINWAAVGGGSVDPATVVTGTNGRAATARVLGPTSGQQSAQASGADLAGSPVTFAHTAIPSNPTTLAAVSGNGQIAPAGFEVAEDLVVLLTDANGNGVGGRSVTWVVGAGGGTVSPQNSTTDPNGLASTRWTLGATAGPNALTAVFSGIPPVPFSATGSADVPRKIALQSGDNQSALVGQTLASPLAVLVTDANNNPVENVSVDWTAIGGGSVSSPTSATNAQGIAQITRTLGLTLGTYTTTADVPGLTSTPITFTSDVIIGPPAKLAFVQQPGGVVVGQTFAPDIQVEILDLVGTRVVTATNFVTISSSRSNTLFGDNGQPAVAGVATFPDLAITRANTAYTLTGLSSGLTGATSVAFDVAKASTSIAILSDTPEPSVSGQAVTINFDVDVVAPGSGILSGSVTVSDGTQNCTDASVDADGLGSCQIVFSTAGDKTLTASYAGGNNFNGSTTAAGTPHTVNRAATNVQVTSDNPDPSTAGELVTVVFTVTPASPGGGTPTGNVTVTVSGGTETCTATVAQGE